MIKLHSDSDKKLFYGALIFVFGIVLSVITFFASNPLSAILAYIDKITIPVFMSFAFIGLSVCVDGYFESKTQKFPTLDTLMLTEELIKKSKKDLTKTELLQIIRKKIKLTDKASSMILAYLEKSDKIHIDKKDGKIVWIWNPKGVEEILKKGLLVR